MARTSSETTPGPHRSRRSIPLPLDCCVATEYCRYLGTVAPRAILAVHSLFSPQGGPVSISRLFSIDPGFVVCLCGDYYASDAALAGLVQPKLCFDATDSPDFGAGHCTRVRRPPNSADYYKPTFDLQLGATRARPQKYTSNHDKIRAYAVMIKRELDNNVHSTDPRSREGQVHDKTLEFIKQRNLRYDEALGVAISKEGGPGAASAVAKWKEVKPKSPHQRIAKEVTTIELRPPQQPAQPRGRDSTLAPDREGLRPLRVKEIPTSGFSIRSKDNKRGASSTSPQVTVTLAPRSPITLSSSPTTSEVVGFGSGGEQELVFLEVPNGPIVGDGTQDNLPRLKGPSGVITFPRLKATALTNDLKPVVLNTTVVPGLRNLPRQRKRNIPANVVSEYQRYLTSLGKDITEFYVRNFPNWSFCEVGGDGMSRILNSRGEPVAQYGPMSLRYPVSPGYPSVVDSAELMAPEHLFVFLHYQNFMSEGTAAYQVKKTAEQRRQAGKSTYILSHALLLSGLEPSKAFDFTRPLLEPVELSGRKIGLAEDPGDVYEVYEAEPRRTYPRIIYERYRWLGDNQTGGTVSDQVVVNGTLLGSVDFKYPGHRRVELIRLGNEYLVFTCSRPFRMGRYVSSCDRADVDFGRIPSRLVRLTEPDTDPWRVKLGLENFTNTPGGFCPLVSDLQAALRGLKPAGGFRPTAMQLQSQIKLLRPKALAYRVPPIPHPTAPPGDGGGAEPTLPKGGPPSEPESLPPDDGGAEEGHPPPAKPPLQGVHTVSLLGCLTNLESISADLSYVGVSAEGLYASNDQQALKAILLHDCVILPSRVAMPIVATVTNEYAQGREMRVGAANAHGSRSVVSDYSDQPAFQSVLYLNIPPFVKYLHVVLGHWFDRTTGHMALVSAELTRRLEWDTSPTFSLARVGMAFSHNWGRFVDQWRRPSDRILPASTTTIPSICRGINPLPIPKDLITLDTYFTESFYGRVKRASAALRRAEDTGVQTAAVLLSSPRKLLDLRCSGHCTHRVVTQYLGVGFDTHPILSSACDYEYMLGFLRRQIGYCGIVPKTPAKELVGVFREMVAGQHPGLMDVAISEQLRRGIHDRQLVHPRPVADLVGGEYADLLDPVTVAEWAANTGSKCTQVFLDMDDLQSLNPGTADHVSVRVNVKREYIGLGGAVAEPCVKPPRIISDRHKDMKLTQLPLTGVISKLLSDLIPGYSVYKTRKEIAAELSAFLESHPGAVSLTGDFAKQDAHTTADMKLSMSECMQILLMLSLTNKERQTIIDDFKASFARSKKSIFTVRDFVFMVLGTVGSGDMTTTVGNTLSSILIFALSVIRVNKMNAGVNLPPLLFTDMCLNFTGDDSLVAVEPQYVDSLRKVWQQTASDFGHELEVQVTYFTGPCGTASSFCSRFYYMSESGGVATCRKVGRALLRFPTTAVPGCPTDPYHPRNVNLLIAKLFSEKADGGFETPVLAGMLEGFASRPDVSARLAVMRKHHFKGLKLDHSQTLWILEWAGSKYHVRGSLEARLNAARRAVGSMRLRADVSIAARLGFEGLTGMTPLQQREVEAVLKSRCSSKDSTQFLPTELIQACLAPEML